jgi:hypothetical protein
VRFVRVVMRPLLAWQAFKAFASLLEMDLLLTILWPLQAFSLVGDCFRRAGYNMQRAVAGARAAVAHGKGSAPLPVHYSSPARDSAWLRDAFLPPRSAANAVTVSLATLNAYDTCGRRPFAFA